MSDEGERMCPLCAEEMDLTDQQLKPCKCGYEICVWCWHHIMEMAEKQDVEGRCPACRTVYDKDRIVGMSSSCERLVPENNGERKMRSQKARAKISAEARKHLSSVRVIQRNLVYIIGLPLSLCHGNLLERREYFGQYGKVLKVSISRSSTGTQQAPGSNTFHVYITYAKEEEAVRCIQAVHNFVLDGKQLRACFGTTKYCHAWLRNMPCNNQDCFYLHDVGSQEDSFTKDEIISAYTRSRVPQVTTSSSQQRLGNVLPPPAEDASKPSFRSAVKTFSSNCTSLKIPAGSSNLHKPAVLPAAASWGSKLSSLVSGIPCSKVTSKQKQENPLISIAATTSKQLHTDLIEKGSISRKCEMRLMVNNGHVSGSSNIFEDADSGSNLSSDLDYSRRASAWHDGDALPSAEIPERSLTVNSDGRSRSLEGSDMCVVGKSHPKMSSTLSLELTFDDDICSSWDDDDTEDKFILPSTTEGKHVVHLKDINTRADYCNSSFTKDYESDTSHSSETNIEPTSSSFNATNSASHAIEEKGIVTLENQMDKSFDCSKEFNVLRTDISNLDIRDAKYDDENSHMLSADITSLEVSSGHGLSVDDVYQLEGSLNDGSLPLGMPKVYSKLPIDTSATVLSRETPSLVAETHFSSGRPDLMEELGERLNSNPVEDNLDATLLPVNYTCSDPGVSNQIVPFPLSKHSVKIPGYQHFLCEDDNHNSDLFRDAMPMTMRGTDVSALLIPDTSFTHQGAKSSECELLENASSNFGKVADKDMLESSIISNILSMDVNPWDTSSPNDIVKLLCENDKQKDGLKFSSLLKGQNKNKSNNQSRFSFARTENKSNHAESFSNENEFLTRNTAYPAHSLARGLDDHTSQYRNGSSLFSSDSMAAFPRENNSARVSAPPGFFPPNRMPPPGFFSPNRSCITQEISAYHTLENSIPRNQYEVSLPGNGGGVEVIDPATVAVCRGRMSPEFCGDPSARSFPVQKNTCENDRSHLLFQKSTSIQDHIISGLVGNIYVPSKDSYIPSQVAQNNGSVPLFPEMLSSSPLNMQISKNHWDAWNADSPNDLHKINEMNMLESLRNELLGLNKYIPGAEEHDFLYNRTFRR